MENPILNTADDSQFRKEIMRINFSSHGEEEFTVDIFAEIKFPLDSMESNDLVKKIEKVVLKREERSYLRLLEDEDSVDLIDPEEIFENCEQIVVATLEELGLEFSIIQPVTLFI